jgi:hypothetical protein
MKTLAIYFCLGLSVATANGRDPSVLSSLWKDGIQAYQKAQYPEAAARFEQWIKEAAAHGTESPEAHFNLGLTYWEMKTAGPAVFHFLKGTLLRNFPSRFRSDLRILSGIQGELGIKDGIPDQWSFQIYLFLSRNVQILSLTLGLWLLILAGVFFFIRFRKFPMGIPASMAVAGLLCILLSAAGFLNHRYQGRFAILNHPSNGIALFRIPRDSAEEKLVELPSGTMIRLGPKQGDGFSQVTEPLAGWVKTEELLAL